LSEFSLGKMSNTVQGAFPSETNRGDRLAKQRTA
jgi:hypothetical protein